MPSYATVRRPPMHFCPEDMVEHLESAHPDNDAAQEWAQRLRATLAESEAGLLSLSKLTAYEASVYIGLTEVVEPEYSDSEALALIQKHSKIIEERERRRFEPNAVARIIQDTESAPVQRLLDAARAVLRHPTEKNYVLDSCGSECPTVEALRQAIAEVEKIS